MYDHRGLALTRIERKVPVAVFDVVGIGFGPGEVADVRPVIDGDRVVCFDIVDSEGEVTRARNLVVLGAPSHPAASLARADAIDFATDHEPPDPGRLLGAAAAYCKRDARGDLRIGPDNRVLTTEHVIGAIHVQPAGGFVDALRSRFVHRLHSGAQAQPSS